MTRLIFLFCFVLAISPVASAAASGADPSAAAISAQSPSVLLEAESINDDLDRDGRAVFYDIFFDSDKAEVRPESYPQLAQIAKALQNNPDLRVFITVHTDNLGMLTYNLALSQRRAQALVIALVRKYGIDARRIVPRGLAQLAPVATNETDVGRAKNRRVEMVALASPL